MAHNWMITIGYLILLGILGGIFVYTLRMALHTEDSVTVDPLPEEKKTE